MTRIGMVFAACALAASACLGAGKSTPAGFTDDLGKGLATAIKEKKPVVVLFTGSDWCHYCKELEQRVLSKPEFAREAPKAFVPVFIDSPSDKSLVSEKAKVENPKLVEKYGINGFPTLLVLDCLGQRVGQVSHGAADTAALVAAVKGVYDGNAKRFETAFEIAAMKKGSAKRLARIEAEIKAAGASAEKEYPAYAEELIAKSKTKYKALLPYHSSVKPLQDESAAILRDLAQEYAKVGEKYGLTPEKAKDPSNAVMKKVQAELLRKTFPKHLKRAKALVKSAEKAKVELSGAFGEELDRVIKGAKGTIEQIEQTIASMKASRGK